MRKLLLLTASHVAVAILGFGLGIYALPILMAPPAPELSDIQAAAVDSDYSGHFRRDLADSDFAHWGEGIVRVGRRSISLEGKIAPGPDYKLYLSPTFVETEDDFKRLKNTMVRVGDVSTFSNFIVPVPESVDVSAHSAVIIWCESFGQFITAAKYQ